MLQHAILAFLVAVVVFPFSYYAGIAASVLKLPRITGYIVSGVLCGPYVLKILSSEALTDLSIIEGACLGIIGLAAGAELKLAELNKSKHQVVSITVAICLATWVFCYLTFWWCTPVLNGFKTFSSATIMAISTLGATLMMARSPASAIAVVKDLDARGPFSSLVMAVVVLKDVVVIVVFAINAELIPVLLMTPSTKASMPVGLHLYHIMLPVIGVLVSLSTGVVGALVLTLLLGTSSTAVVSAPAVVRGLNRTMAGWGLHLSQLPTEGGGKALLILLVTTAVFQGTHMLDAEPLLACVTMGMVLANRRVERLEKEGDDLVHVINQIMSVSNVAFFGLAGASLKLAALMETIWVAVVVFFVRLGAIWGGSWLGCAFSRAPPDYKQLFWCTMITQAGVAMGLARLAATRFPSWGPQFQALMTSIIVINMLVGPPLFRWSLMSLGEVRLGSILGPLHRDEFVGDVKSQAGESGSPACRPVDLEKGAWLEQGL